MDIAEKICNKCPARAANNCPYENYPHLKRKCEYRSDVMYGYDLAMAELEKSVSKDLDEVIVEKWKMLNSAGNDIPFDTFNGIACYFSKWGAEHTRQPPPPN